jgi:hypothetical protein
MAEVPIGGGVGAALTKTSANDYDVEWKVPDGAGDMLKSEYDPNDAGYDLDDFLTLDGTRTMFGSVKVQIDGPAVVCTSPATGEVLTLDPGHILHVVPGVSPQGALLYVNGDGDWWVHDVATGVEFPITDFANGKVAGIQELEDALDDYLPLAGGTMLGELYLAADPVGAMEAATKQYTDRHLLLDGTRPMTGQLSLATITPVARIHAASKGYVDDLFTSAPLFIGVIDASTGLCTFTPESGFTNGQLPDPTTTDAGDYVICITPGTIPAGSPAAGIIMIKGDWLYCTGSIWTLINVGAVPGGQVFARDVIVAPTVFAADDVQEALEYIEQHLDDLPNGWVWRGHWNAITAYVVNNLVDHNQSVWLCLIANTNSEPIAGNLNWSVVFTLPALPPGTGDMLKSVYDPNDDGMIDRALQLTGGTLTGRLILASDPAPGNDLDAATKQYVDNQANPLPTGGATGQVLAKASPVNYNLRWQNPTPTGGNDGDVLTKVGAPDFSVGWRPTGGIVDDNLYFKSRGYNGSWDHTTIGVAYTQGGPGPNPPPPGGNGAYVFTTYRTGGVTDYIIQESFGFGAGTTLLARGIRTSTNGGATWSGWTTVPLNDALYARIVDAVMRDGRAAMTGRLTLAPLDPTDDYHAASKLYVDRLVAGSRTLIGGVDADTGLCEYTIESGLTDGPLPLANTILAGHYVVCTNPGTFRPTGEPADVTMVIGDVLISDGDNWFFLGVGAGVSTVQASQVFVSPPVLGTSNAQATLEAIVRDYMPLIGGEFTGIVSGLDPIVDEDLATKKYVDDQVATGGNTDNTFIVRGSITNLNQASFPGTYTCFSNATNLPVSTYGRYLVNTYVTSDSMKVQECYCYDGAGAGGVPVGAIYVRNQNNGNWGVWSRTFPGGGATGEYVEKAGDEMSGPLRFWTTNPPVAPPSTGTAARSTGTRLALYPAASGPEFGIGIENGSMWFNVVAATNFFRFYTASVKRLELDNASLTSLVPIQCRVSGSGFVRLSTGQATQTGIVEFLTQEGTRRGYVGYKGTFNTLLLKAEAGWNWEFADALVGKINIQSPQLTRSWQEVQLIVSHCTQGGEETPTAGNAGISFYNRNTPANGGLKKAIIYLNRSGSTSAREQQFVFNDGDNGGTCYVLARGYQTSFAKDSPIAPYATEEETQRGEIDLVSIIKKLVEKVASLEKTVQEQARKLEAVQILFGKS